MDSTRSLSQPLKWRKTASWSQFSFALSSNGLLNEMKATDFSRRGRFRAGAAAVELLLSSGAATSFLLGGESCGSHPGGVALYRDSSRVSNTCESAAGAYTPGCRATRKEERASKGDSTRSLESKNWAINVPAMLQP